MDTQKKTEYNLSVKGLRKSYKKTFHQAEPVLKNISFETKPGECIGIIGANGCGKSTLLSILAGTLKPESGTISYYGSHMEKIRKMRPCPIGYVPQEPPLIPELTAYDNLKLWYCDSSLSLKEGLQHGFLALLDIPSFLKVPVKKMSGGMRKRLAIGCCMANHPNILLLDEPGAALDIPCREKIEQYLKKYTSLGNTVILTTHEEREIALCDSLYLLKNGTLSPYRYRGDIHELATAL